MVIHLCQRRSSRSRWRCCADANAGAVRCRCACAAAAKTTAAADAAAAARWAQQFNAASSSASSTATACASATANAVARIAAGSEVNSTARKHRDARRMRKALLCSARLSSGGVNELLKIDALNSPLCSVDCRRAQLFAALTRSPTLTRSLRSQLNHSRSSRVAVAAVVALVVRCPRCSRCECTIKLFTNCVFDETTTRRSVPLTLYRSCCFCFCFFHCG